MTPKFCVNAWLEREKPIIELRENYTDRTVFSVKGELLSDWISSGEIDISDYCESNPNLQELVKELLLKSISVATPVVTNKKVVVNNILYFPILRKILKNNKNAHYRHKAKVITLLTKRMI